MRVERRIMAVERGAVRADDFGVVAHVEKHMRVIEWRPGADAHEFARADFDHGNTRIVVKVWNDVLGHVSFGTCPGNFAPQHSGPQVEFLDRGLEPRPHLVFISPSMPQFHHGPVQIAYLDEGVGEPIVLVHGFASTKEVNWINPGWLATLTGAGRRVIALDNRGHGASTKLYDPGEYHTSLMADDVTALIDHLGLGPVDVMGYSMGARIVAFLAHNQPARVRAIVLGGLGMHLIDGVGLPESIADALEAPSLEQVTDPQGRMFRAFAEQTRSDRNALAACIRGSRQTLTREQVATIKASALVAVGSKDPIAGSAEALAALMPRAQALVIPDRDHMIAVGDKVFKAGVVKFLKAPA